MCSRLLLGMLVNRYIMINCLLLQVLPEESKNICDQGRKIKERKGEFNQGEC